MKKVNKKIFEYAKLAAQQLGKKEINNLPRLKEIREELKMTHEEIIDQAAIATLNTENN